MKNQLWPILVEACRSISTYNSNLAYVREHILPERPDIAPNELASRIGITLGEAMVILYDLVVYHDELIDELKNQARKTAFKYNHGAIGGTFNEVHLGHLCLFEKAFNVAKKVFVGVTGDELVAVLGKTHPVRPYEERVQEAKEELKKLRLLERAVIDKIEDPYGPAAYDASIEVVITSPLTAKTVQEINVRRGERNLRPVDIEMCRIVLAEDNLPISSTRIASGEIAKDGRIRRKSLD